MLKNIAFIVLISGMLSGCLKGSTGNDMCSYDACQQKAPEAEVQAVQSYITSNNIQATKHCSGMFYSIEAAGTGKNAEACSNITINYKGALTNGTVFDQSTSPVTFPLYQLIVGWRNGIPLIKEGGKIRLFIPPSLGYGNREQPGIPAGSILVFDVELKQVQ